MIMHGPPEHGIRLHIYRQLQHEGAVLLPLRLFIGLGWTRAALEKLLDPAWLDGTVVTRFFETQLATDAIYFPFYQSWVAELFAPNALCLSWAIMVGQLLAGIAIGLGLLTNLALLGGLFMNLNFILIGRVNPSAFYIVIQTALYEGNAGTVLGVDGLLMARRIPLVPQRLFRGKRWGYLFVSFVSWLLALLMVPFIRDFGPHSVSDPAMLLFILSALGGLSSFILFARRSPSFVTSASSYTGYRGV